MRAGIAVTDLEAGLARPDGADFMRCVVADGKHEVHLGCVRFRKLVPTLASEPSRRNVRGRQLPQRLGTNRTRWMTAGALRRESRFSFGVHRTLRHD
jgi:hypothetical protein